MVRWSTDLPNQETQQTNHQTQRQINRYNNKSTDTMTNQQTKQTGISDSPKVRERHQLIKFARQTVGLLLLSGAPTSLIYRLCHVMRDRPRPTHRSTFYNVVEIHCNARFRVSRVVEAHFRDADNNQHRSFQGRETLPLIEDSCLRPPFV